MKACKKDHVINSTVVALLLFFIQVAAVQNVVAGIITPVESLDVAGNIKADTLKPAAIKLLPNASAGKLQVSNVAGNASWQNINTVISSGHPSSFDYHVSSINGNDNNSGLSSATAKKTIAALSGLLTAGKSIGIEKGSHFREMLKIDAPNVVIGTYGTGSNPVLDATEVIRSSAINTVGGYRNLYQFAITPITSGGQSFSFLRTANV